MNPFVSVRVLSNEVGWKTPFFGILKKRREKEAGLSNDIQGGEEKRGIAIEKQSNYYVAWLHPTVSHCEWDANVFRSSFYFF